MDPLFFSTQRPTDAEIAEIVRHFVAGDLSNAEAEAAFERLGKAKKRVLPAVVTLCRSSDPELYQAGVLLAKEINLTWARGPLRELLEDPSLDDEHKMSLLTALEALGGLNPGENPLIYLRDPRAALDKSHEAFLDSLQDPFQLGVLLEREFDASNGCNLIDPIVLQGMASTQDRRLRPLLMCLVHAPEDSLALAAIEALRILGDNSVVATLEERAHYDSSPSVRKAARRAVADLSRDPSASPPSILHLPLAPPPVVRCLISTIDGNGGQVCLVVRQVTGDGPVVLDIMFNDHEGISDCEVAEGETVEELEKSLVSGLEDIGIEMVDIGLPQARAELERAYQVTLRCHKRLPPNYLAWRSWLCGEDPRPVDSYPLPRLQPHERDGLLARSSELLYLDEFASWAFEPNSVGDMERKYRKLARRGSDGDALETLINQALEHSAHRSWCDLVESRLERQAWLLAQVYEEEDIPKMTLAAAAALSSDSSVRPTDHPLLREMMRRTLLGVAAAF
jgi:hypothetical protein